MFTPRCAALILSLSLGLPAAQAATVANVTVPDTVTVEQQSLKLNGAGLRKKVVFDVYVAALYTASPSQDADAIIQSPGPHQVRLVLKRDLDAQTLIDALKDGIHSNLTDPERQELDPVIKQFEDLMRQVGEAKEGDIVFVSAAAGAVGSAVVQIAKAKGMTVIGSAGGAEKCAWVRELGADAAIDYKAGPIVRSLMEAAPKGIDVYFDNVGGDHLDAALAAARNHARFAICGMIDSYNGGRPPAFRYIMRVIAARIRMQGFIYTDYLPEMGDFYRDMDGWVASGQITSRETVRDGLEAAPQAFLDLFSGANMGKMLVRL